MSSPKPLSLSLPVPQALAVAMREFRRWRGKHGSRGRIPGRLWQLAVGAAVAHGVAATAEALGLDGAALGVRVGAVAGSVPAFVEVLPPLAKAAGVVLELRDAGGASLRVELPVGLVAEVGEVARALWEASR